MRMFGEEIQDALVVATLVHQIGQDQNTPLEETIGVTVRCRGYLRET